MVPKDLSAWSGGDFIASGQIVTVDGKKAFFFVANKQMSQW